MTPAQKHRILQAHRTLHEAEKLLAARFETLTAALDSELAPPLINTLHGMIAAHLSGSMSKADIDVFVEFIAVMLNVPKASAQALADYKIASCDFGLALRDTDPSCFKGSANG